jgi:hypothetical protein
MKRFLVGEIASASLLALAACAPLRSGDGESYTVGGNPWEPSTAQVGGGTAAERGSKVDSAAADAAKPAKEGVAATSTAEDGGPAVDGARPGIDGAPIVAGGTVLEQLDAAKRRVGELEQENRRLVAELASSTMVIEQLKRDNSNLAQLAQQSQESRTAVDGELDTLQLKIKDLELRSRQLADDLLSERIKRVRIERQLILAKVTEAESSSDGP